MGIADSRKRLGGRRGRRAHLDNPSRPEADPAAIAQERQERKQADDQRRREERSAQLIAEASRRRDSSRCIDHTIRLRNVGPAAARDVYVWLALLLAGDEVSAPASYQTHVGSVVPDAEWIAFTVTPGTRRSSSPHGATATACTKIKRLAELASRREASGPRSRNRCSPALVRSTRTQLEPKLDALGGGASRRRR